MRRVILAFAALTLMAASADAGVIRYSYKLAKAGKSKVVSVVKTAAKVAVKVVY